MLRYHGIIRLGRVEERLIAIGVDAHRQHAARGGDEPPRRIDKERATVFTELERPHEAGELCQDKVGPGHSGEVAVLVYDGGRERNAGDGFDGTR